MTKLWTISEPTQMTLCESWCTRIHKVTCFLLVYSLLNISTFIGSFGMAIHDHALVRIDIPQKANI